MFLKKLQEFFAAKPVKQNNRILIIDDNPIDQKVICAAIERAGHRTFKAFDGKTGLAMAGELLPDLIILDYNLPDISGPKVCEALKADGPTGGIPVLFLTWRDSPNSIIDCYDYGGENYLAKPINPKLLVRQIEQILEDKKLKG